MRSGDKVRVIIAGQHRGREGMITELDWAFGVCGDLGHVDPNCFHIFNPGDLQVVE